MKNLTRMFLLVLCIGLLAAFGIALAPTVSAGDYNTLVHFEQGGAQLTVEDGGNIAVLDGGTLTLESGSSLIESNINLTEKNLTATYGVAAATGAFTGAVDIAGQVTMGAAGTKSTMTVSGALTAHTSVTAPAIVGSTSVSGAKVVATAGPIVLYSRTKAQILALTPAAVGEAYYCSDCAAVTMCTSTGTAVGAWVKSSDRTAVCN